MGGEEGGGGVCVWGGHGHGDHCTVTSHRHPTLHGLPAAQPLHRLVGVGFGVRRVDQVGGEEGGGGVCVWGGARPWRPLYSH